MRSLLSNLSVREELEKGRGKSGTAVIEDGAVRLEVFAVEPSEKEGASGQCPGSGGSERDVRRVRQAGRGRTAGRGFYWLLLTCVPA